DDDDRPLSNGGRRLVNGSCDQLLAGPGLTLDEDRRCRLRDTPDKIKDLAHARILAYHVAERPMLLEFGAQRDQFVLELPFPQRTLNEEAKVIVVERLGEEIVGPE